MVNTILTDYKCPKLPEPCGWLYEWTHSSATGRADEEFTGFTRDEKQARRHEAHRNVRAAYTAEQMEAYADAREAAVLAKLREQEPAAYVKENPYCPQGHSDELSTYLPAGMILYAYHPPESMPVSRLLADLDEIIRLTVSVSRSSEPTTTDYYEKLNRRNELVRDFRAMLEVIPKSKGINV